MVKRTRMEENKRVYEAEYDTDEYESLTCECHHLARAKELNGSRRKPFFCIYCKTVYKDKNKLNLHRLEGCFAVTGDGRKTVLKIYPVFGKGQRGEIEEILIKHGHMNPRKKPSRAKRKKSAAALKEADTSIEVEMTVQGAEEEHTQLRPQKLRVRGMLSSAHEAKKKHVNLEESDLQISYGHHEQVVDNPDSGEPLVVGQGEMQVQMQLTREQVEAQAWGDAKFMLPDASVVSSPQVVPCPGLWHLMKFQLLPGDFPDVEDDNFHQAFFEFVDKGLIDPALRSSYGTWYMERETDADDEEQCAVKLTMSRFKLVGGRPDLHARHKERTALQEYLQYLKELSQYEAQKAAAEADLQSRREMYVKNKLDEFDAKEHAHKELAVWHWSPLLHLLNSDPIRGVPPRPWLHSDTEQKKIAHAILSNRNLFASDPPHCPIIVRMFKIVYLYCFDKTSTLSDPVTGLLRETMLGYSTSESAAPVLKISAQSVLNEGCYLFANLPPHSEAQAEVYQDISSLLNGTEAAREVVVQKVQNFLKIVRQRAAGDMAQLHPQEFRVLWCGGDESDIADSLKKFMLCLKSREDLDMGWVPFPSGHPDCDSVAVMQAREAVMKAINKLHDQRVHSDKSRLLEASSCLKGIDINTHEKFHALVETCVGKSERQVSIDSANGSPGKEGLEAVSKVDRDLSCSSGSAEIGQILQSPREVKKTGISFSGVERTHHMHELVDEPSRKPIHPSPDLNLNLDSSDSYNPGPPIMKSDMTLTPHMAGLHVKPAAPTTKVSVLGFEVQTSDPSTLSTVDPGRPAAHISSLSPFPLHFHGPSSDVQPSTRHDYLLNSTVSRPAPLQPDMHADNVRVVSSRNATRLSENSLGAETSASANQALENPTRLHLLFNTRSSFSTTSSANTHNDSSRDSSATPVLTVARPESDQ